MDDDFLTPTTEEPMTGDAVLDLTHKTKEELFQNLKVRGNLGFSDHEM